MSNSTSTPLTVELRHEHLESTAYAKRAAERDLREIDYSLGQEALADVFAWGQSVRYASESLITWSPGPLYEGAHYFESAASTIPIIGPLIKERIESAKTDKRIGYLQKALIRNPDTKLYEAEAWELEILNKPNGHIPSIQPEPDKGFLRGMFNDWVNTFRRKALKSLGGYVFKASFNVLRLPFKGAYNIEAAKNSQLQMARLQKMPKTFYSNIELEIDTNTGLMQADSQKIDQHREDSQSRYRRRSWLLCSSGVATICAANFIQNEMSATFESAAELVQPESPVETHHAYNNDSDPLTSSFLAAALVFAHLIPATLTVSPLRKASKKVTEHFNRISHWRTEIDMLDFVKQRLEEQELGFDAGGGGCPLANIHP